MNNRKKNPVDVYIGKRLYELRMQKGMTHKELTRETLISQKHLMEIEAGTHRQLISHLGKIIYVFGADFMTLYDGLEEAVPITDLVQRLQYVEKLFTRFILRHHTRVKLMEKGAVFGGK